MPWKQLTEIGHCPDKVSHPPRIPWPPMVLRLPSGYSLSRARMIEPTSATSKSTEATSKGKA